jgi:hypothetical protein
MLAPRERTELHRARSAFARLAAAKAISYARDARRQGRLRDASATALWASGQFARASLVGARARLAGPG